MKCFSFVLVLGMSATSLAQGFDPIPIPPPNFYGGRFTVMPDGRILPTQPLVNTLQPIQHILGNLCGLGSSLGGIAGTQGKPLQFLCTARNITNYSVETIQNLNGDLANFSNRAAGSLANRVIGTFGERANLGWFLGSTFRKRGSLLSDTWTGNAAELASRDAIVVYPASGCWKERKSHGRFDRKARYAMVVSLQVETDVDIYTQIETAIVVAAKASVQPQILVEIDVSTQ